MSKNSIFRGMGSINLFPEERSIDCSLNLPRILSDQEAFRNDLEQVGQDMWNAIGKYDLEHSSK